MLPSSSVPLKVEGWRVWVLIRDFAVGPKRRPIPKEIVPSGIFDESEPHHYFVLFACT